MPAQPHQYRRAARHDLPDDLREERRADMQRRTQAAKNRAIKIIKQRFPKEWAQAHALATEEIDRERGPLPGDSNWMPTNVQFVDELPPPDTQPVDMPAPSHAG